ERGRLERAAGDLGLRDRVDFVGAVDHDTLPELMQGFSVLLNTSRSESFGVVLLEAGACALPVVATRVGGVSEVVDDGATGILVPVGDAAAAAAALVRLARDPDEARSMGEAGRARVAEHFRWSECVDAMLRALEEARR
ncbi:MAG TPA: glycosyltransferase, partial [Acidimicrobiia bacterium]|nr:glycosyltransferase [Acidimicrobiia bacterium]